MFSNVLNQYQFIKRRKFLLGTYVDITLKSKRNACSESRLLHLSQYAYQKIADIEQEMNFYNKTSLLSYINLNAHKTVIPLSAHLNIVLQCAKKLYHQTQGLFDVSNGNFNHVLIKNMSIQYQKPLKINLNGIAKGFAVDQAFEFLKRHSDLSSISVNAGGDLRTTEPYVLIKDAKRNQVCVLKNKKEAIATSGNCYTDKNIVNPLTKANIKLATPVSILADKCMIADALTKPVAIHPENFHNILNYYGAQLFIQPISSFSPSFLD